MFSLVSFESLSALGTRENRFFRELMNFLISRISLLDGRFECACIALSMNNHAHGPHSLGLRLVRHLLFDISFL